MLHHIVIQLSSVFVRREGAFYLSSCFVQTLDQLFVLIKRQTILAAPSLVIHFLIEGYCPLAMCILTRPGRSDVVDIRCVIGLHSSHETHLLGMAAGFLICKVLRLSLNQLSLTILGSLAIVALQHSCRI